MKIEIPTNCPCCNATLELVNAQLFCRNSACPAQLNKKLEHFAKVLGIRGLGEKTIAKLALSDITELFYLDRDQTVEVLSSTKLADKLLLEIDQAKGADLATVIASMSIPLVGVTLATKVCSVVDCIDEITPEKCKEAGLGDKATANLMDWLENEFPEMKEFLPFTFVSKRSAPASNAGDKPIVCITGKLSSVKTKSEAASLLVAAGYHVVDTVTKTTQYLLDEGSKGSEKRKKAEANGITIITNLFDLVNKENV